MQAMILQAAGEKLVPVERPDPEPGPDQVRVAISACGVCRTDLHVLDGELPGIKYPIIPGHEIVGRVEALGAGVTSLKIGQGAIGVFQRVTRHLRLDANPGRQRQKIFAILAGEIGHRQQLPFFP